MASARPDARGARAASDRGGALSAALIDQHLVIILLARVAWVQSTGRHTLFPSDRLDAWLADEAYRPGAS